MLIQKVFLRQTRFYDYILNWEKVVKLVLRESVFDVDKSEYGRKLADTTVGYSHCSSTITVIMGIFFFYKFLP